MPPSEGQQAQNLPAQIRRQHQKPGDVVAISDFCAQTTEEIAVAKAAIAAEYGFSDEIDDNWHNDQAKKQKACEYGHFFSGEPPEGRRLFWFVQ